MVKLKHQGESIQGGEDGAVEADYIISGAATKEAALEQLLDPANTAEAISHPTYGTLYREQVPQLDEIDAEQGFWTGKVRWTVPNADASLDENEPIVSFNTIGGSGHLTHSKETIAQATLDSAFDGTPDFHRAIGVSSDGDVDGTEIIVPIYEWEETHLVNASTVTRNFRRDIFQATGTVCTAEFRDFAIGEALFMGASGTSHGTSKPWEINFRFAGSANAKRSKSMGSARWTRTAGITSGSITSRRSRRGDISPRSRVSSLSASTNASRGLSCPEAGAGSARARTSSTRSAHEPLSACDYYTRKADAKVFAIKTEDGRPIAAVGPLEPGRGEATTPSRTTSSIRASPRGTGTSGATSSPWGASGCDTARSRASSPRRPSAARGRSRMDGRDHQPIERSPPASSFPGR
jgi:hypothetical protein